MVEPARALRAARGELHLPPAHEHAEQPEPRADLPDAAPPLAQLGARDALEAVAAGVEAHALEADPGPGLALAAAVELGPCGGQARGQLVPDLLELAEVEDARAVPGPGRRLATGGQRGRGGGGVAVRQAGDQGVREPALETGDLAAKLGAGGGGRRGR